MKTRNEIRDHRPAFLSRSVRRGRPGVLPGALALAAAAVLMGVPATAAPASAADLCPTDTLCLYVGGIGTPEPLQIRQCQSRTFDPPFRTRKVENNTGVIARISTAGGETVTVQPGAAVNFAPDLRVVSAGTPC
ncbi:hypothetical protein ACQEVX_03105 [Streptomyces syringium]|uniref:hypothetical protein n=1 Tax=Streptomyces syringium TaxID=76729 RepID=UPI003D8D6C9D